jgi:hypothetical protein
MLYIATVDFETLNVKVYTLTEASAMNRVYIRLHSLYTHEPLNSRLRDTFLCVGNKAGVMYKTKKGIMTREGIITGLVKGLVTIYVQDQDYRCEISLPLRIIVNELNE